MIIEKLVFNSCMPDSNIDRLQRLPGPARAFLFLSECEEFFFQTEVLFAGFRRPAHTGKAIAFGSHRAMFVRVDHCILPRAFHRPQPAPERGRGTLKGVPSTQISKVKSPNALRWRFDQAQPAPSPT